MKTIIVACGGGIATSTVIADEIQQLADANRIKINLIQCTINEMSSYFGEASLLVTSSPIREELPLPYVVGTCFITGMGMDAAKENILKILKQ